MNQTDPQHREMETHTRTNSFPETQNRQADTKEMHRRRDIQLNKDKDEYNGDQAIHSNKDQH